MNLTEIHINTYFIIFLSAFTIRNLLEVIFIPKSKSKGKGFISLVIFSALFFIIGISVGYSLLVVNSINTFLFFTGIIIFFIFHQVRLFCIKKMGTSYSQLITPNNDCTLITTGFYSIIRHPLYSFYLFELVGLTMMKFNYIALTAVITDVLVTLNRIRNEEKLLVEKYGKDYISYKEKTWKLIPFLC